jgi:DNA polymerase-1
MVSRWTMDNKMNMVIASSDRDYYQLITDSVHVFNARDNKIIDVAAVKERYGLRPDQLIDLKSLAGDSGDNIPGAYGIGEKTALGLLHRFGSVDEIMKFQAVLTPKIQRSLEISKANIEMSRVLGTIVTDYKLIDLTLDKIIFQSYRDPKIVFSLLQHLELFSLFEMFRFSLLPLTEPAINDNK